MLSSNRRKLEKAAAFTFSEEIQRRLEDLLFKKREGQLTGAEARELEALVMEVQIKTIEKARAMYLLSKQKK